MGKKARQTHTLLWMGQEIGKTVCQASSVDVATLTIGTNGIQFITRCASLFDFSPLYGSQAAKDKMKSWGRYGPR